MLKKAIHACQLIVFAELSTTWQAQVITKQFPIRLPQVQKMHADQMAAVAGGQIATHDATQGADPNSRAGQQKA